VTKLWGMKSDSLKKYIAMRQSLTAEKARLEARLKAINEALGESSSAPAKGRRGGPRFMSAEARARISAAQKARWAKLRAKKA
jgi:hypothetical protein